jgi:hypothetical protein
MTKRFEETIVMYVFFMAFEVLDCCEAEGHCEHHNYRSDPQFIAERGQEILQFKILKLCPMDIYRKIGRAHV